MEVFLLHAFHAFFFRKGIYFDNHSKFSFCQGAVENLLERSAYVQLLDGSVVLLDDGARSLIMETLKEMSTNTLRCLGFAYKDDLSDFDTYDGEDHPAHKLLLDPSKYSDIEKNLVFVGLVGLRVSGMCSLHT